MNAESEMQHGDGLGAESTAAKDGIEHELTLATVANMRRFKALNPGREIPGGGRIEGRRCFALSLETGEQCSADPGDYFARPDDQPLVDSAGEPMVLAVSATVYRDAISGEVV
jgi:hypothetical protein